MWLYEGKELEHEISSEYYGFVYWIKNTLSGKSYIGRKYFTRAATKQVKGKRKTTIVKQLPFSNDEIKEQLKMFKTILGCNGTYKNNYMLFLGDHKNYIIDYYKNVAFVSFI